jgi:hypothetical protein
MKKGNKNEKGFTRRNHEARAAQPGSMCENGRLLVLSFRELIVPGVKELLKRLAAEAVSVGSHAARGRIGC